jgi:26S proteasome regulatory subunit N1
VRFEYLSACLPVHFVKGLQDASDATIETLKAIGHPISRTAQILVEACSFAGTGNVLKIQAMLHQCDEHVNSSTGKKDDKDDKDDKKEEKPDEKPDDTFQAFAVIAIALIAMGEDIGAEMSLRQFNHLVSRRKFSWKFKSSYST